MEYNKIIAVTGLPGLYELLSSKSDGAIVRSLDDKTTRFVSSRVHNFSHLESIEVYTVRNNVNLVEILKAMEVGTAKLPDEKDAAALKNYFTKVYPDLDFSRVYSSDLKKMVKWFSVLKANNIEIKLTEAEEQEVTDEVAEDVDGLEEVEGEEKAKAKKPAKKKEEAEKAAIVEKPAAVKAPAAVKKAVASPKGEAKSEAKSEAKAKPEKKEPAKKAAASSKSATKAKAEKKEPAKKAAKKK